MEYTRSKPVSLHNVKGIHNVKTFLMINGSEMCIRDRRGRPMLPQTMEFISAMGTIFQSYMKDEITIDDFCAKAKEYSETYNK